MVILKAVQSWIDCLCPGGANAEVTLVGRGQGPPVTISKSLLITVATPDLQTFLYTTDCHCQAPVTIMIPSATNSTLLQVSQVLSQGKADIVSGHQTSKRRPKEVEDVESVLELLTAGVHVVKTISGGGENASPKLEDVAQDIDSLRWAHKGTKKELEEELYGDQDLSVAGTSYIDQGAQQEDGEISHTMDEDLEQQQVLNNNKQLPDIVTHDNGVRETGRELGDELYDDQDFSTAGPSYNGQGDQQDEDGDVRQVIGGNLAQQNLFTNHMELADFVTHGDGIARETVRDLAQQVPSIGRGGGNGGKYQVADKPVEKETESLSSNELLDEIDALLKTDDEEVEKTADIQHCAVAKDIVGPIRQMAKKTGIVGHSVGKGRRQESVVMGDSEYRVHKRLVAKDSRVNRKFERYVVSKSYGKQHVRPKPVLDESVVDFGMIRSKFSGREQQEMVPRKLKKEREDPPNLLECNFCQKTYTIAASMASHMVQHSLSRENVFCPICSFSTDQTRLVKHIRSQHSMEMVYSCDICKMKFCNFDAKSAHVKKHDNPDLCQCPKCGSKKFYNIQLGRGCTNCSKK